MAKLVPILIPNFRPSTACSDLSRFGSLPPNYRPFPPKVISPSSLQDSFEPREPVAPTGSASTQVRGYWRTAETWPGRRGTFNVRDLVDIVVLDASSELILPPKQSCTGGTALHLIIHLCLRL